MVDVSKLKPTWLWVIGDEGPPPSIERQIKRMFCLTAMTVLSASAEAIKAGSPDMDDALAQFDQTISWIKANADDELTEEERECINTEPKRWTQRQLVDGNWRFQAAAVIGWALGLAEWLPIWESYGPEHFDFVFIETSAAEVEAIAQPRPRQEIDLKNSVACAWLWRCRNEQVNPPSGFFERRKLSKHYAGFAAECFKSGEFLLPVGGDFSVDGKPFGKLDRTEQDVIHSRATERLRALNWLHGQDPDYQGISCDT